mmetsp:Transcript_48380/g.151688  ORF Transcript_48380/g.151688 Transcript_48380/m.151688 type:complete len:218 (-) Transcript_48380:560-1213(-)
MRYCVVRLKGPGGDVEAHEHVEGVMLVGGKDAKHAEPVENCREGVEGSPGTRGVGADKAIEDREHCGMPAEHVVAACAGPLQRGSKSGRDLPRMSYLVFNRHLFWEGAALEVDPWDRQRSDEHRAAAEHEDGAGDGEDPAEDDEPVYMKDARKGEDRRQKDDANFRSLKGSWNHRNIVQHNIRKGRMLCHIRNTIMYECHHTCCRHHYEGRPRQAAS